MFVFIMRIRVRGILCLLLCVSFMDYLSHGQTLTPSFSTRRVPSGLCAQGQYGENCEYQCHCPIGIECDPVTGQCPAECAPGWSGAPYCQSENVALKKSTFQHGTYLGWNSSRAVDGNIDQDGTYGSCAWAHNGNDVFKTWWNVDLGALHYIQSIEIYFRTDDAMSQSRRAGVRLYVSESREEAKNEGLCYMDQMNDMTFPSEHLILRDGSMLCTQRTGRFVILYVDRPTQTPIRNCPTNNFYSCWANLELCEVQVYACTNGTYGDRCQYRCHCQDNTACHGSTGVCPSVCQPGWNGTNCDQKCLPGRYDVNCEKPCGHCLVPIDTCDRVTGSCDACKPGWLGTTCDQACPPGTYGIECQRSCGNCIGTCDPETGVCSLGCKPGWLGTKCDVACSDGTYGPSCEARCTNCKDGAACNHVTGNCPDGCAPGYTSSRCNQECEAGRYGSFCSLTCGKCRDNAPCDHVTGSCANGCANGYKDSICKEVCPSGSYGNQCSGECGQCRGGEPCDHVTGVCPNGCDDGWTGEKCKNQCQPGRYGTACLSSCGECRDGDPCNHVTGTCTNGCNNGWKGDRCIENCDPGFFGKDCATPCGSCKNGTSCDYIDGLCPHGCESDFYGERCDKSLTIDEDNIQGASDADTGEEPDMSMLIGGVMGGVVLVCLGVMLIILIRSFGQKLPATPLGRPCKYEGPNMKRKSSGAKRRKGNLPRRETHSQVEIVQDQGHGNQGHQGHQGHVNTAASNSPTPSRTSSLATIKTNCTQSHISIDDQEVLYVNLKKKNPTPLPIPVPSPKLSTFQRKVVQNGSTTDSEPTYYNTMDRLTSRGGGVPVQKFGDHVKEMDTDKNRFKEEFSHYAHGLKYAHEAGKRPRNKFKNRFAQMFPYDHSRVVLEEEPSEADSDYINANFIDSVDFPNNYIATQGPNKITLNDFWKMIWQAKSGKIVMLTNLVEESKNKCERYWPNERMTNSYGDIEVTLNQSQEYPFYTLRIMTLHHKRFSDDVRTIKQFHFTAWPDHGVPDTFEIVSFFKCVLRVPINLPGPLVVHCSAGVGRTGTFITLDAMYHYGKRGGNIDIPTFVHKMRQQRMNMIQTIDQYRLVHYALQEALGYGDTTLNKLTFVAECHSHVEQYNAAQHNRISDEFQKLENLKPKLGNEYFLAALRKENVEKNRSLNVLAADRYRPYLSTYVPDTTDYINAIVVPSRNNKHGYIVTQLPMKHTIVDFWRLIYDHGSTLIVTLNALDEDQDDSCAFWPSLGDSITFGPLVVETLAVETPYPEVTERTFRILRKGIKDSKLVYMITYNDWYPDKYLPTSIDSFLVLLGRVNLYRKSFPDAPLTVLCLDGVTCSGVFVASNNALDQVVQDQEVDIFNTARQIQLRRPHLIKNKDQYLFVYQSVCKYIESTAAVYGNVS